jgi:hypothetical protein
MPKGDVSISYWRWILVKKHSNGKRVMSNNSASIMVYRQSLMPDARLAFGLQVAVGAGVAEIDVLLVHEVENDYFRN